MNRRIKVLATSCGGGIGPDVASSLKRSSLNLHVIGMDASDQGRYFGTQVCDEVIEAPLASAPDYKEQVDRICERHGIDVIIFNHSKELRAIAERELIFNAKYLLPNHVDMLICTSKWKVVKKLLDKGLKDTIPRTSLVDREKTVAEAFKEFKSPLWLRIPEGAGARGALLVSKPKHAIDWIDYWEDMKGYGGQWMLQEYLPGKNFSWCSIWHKGQFIASSTMERLEYFMASAAVTGISGATSVCRIVHDDRLQKLGMEVVQGLSNQPQGVFTMDAREDAKGNVKLTEIENRMQGRNRLHTSAGVNLPEIIIRLLMGIALDGAMKKVDGGIAGTTLYRQLDLEPVIKFGHGEAEKDKYNPLLMWDDEKYGRDLSKLDKNQHGEGREYKWT